MSVRYLASYLTNAAGSVTGTLAASESGADTAAMAGVVPVSGVLAAAESGADTASLAGAVVVSGAMAASEAGGDTASMTGTASSGGTSAGWDEILSNGLTAGATLVAVHQMLLDLHRIHGLTAGVPLVVAQTQRSAGDIVQSVVTQGGVTAVTRQ